MYHDIFYPLLREAGRRMLAADNDDIDAAAQLKNENPANLVTAYDTAIQEYLKAELLLLFPEAVFLAEEQENDKSVLGAARCFVIDPIDGTANFIHGYRRSCISLAMLENGIITAGAVYDPYNDELFYAERGRGTTVNGRPVRVAKRPPEGAMAVFGTAPYYKDIYGKGTFAMAEAIFRKTRDVRRSGTAAIDLAYVAAGRCDMFFEFILSPWDIAAGILLISEAGGIATDMRGNPLTLEAPVSVMAASPACYPTLAAEAKKYFI